MNIFNSLTFRIFAIFALMLTLVLFFVLLLPKLDSRQLNDLNEKDLRQGQILVQHIQNSLSLVPDNDFRWWIRLIDVMDEWAPHGQQLFMLTSEGRVVSPSSLKLNIVRNFIGISNQSQQPQKKIYANQELLGPFEVNDTNESYNLYLIRPANNFQSKFIDLIFDYPILLLFTTLLISTPLLLWLAWSLAKPARKLKAAAEKVAKGDLTPHPELESGPIEFRSAGASFNKMTHDLDTMLKAQYRLISDISHELRTPLTRLQLAAALIRRRHGETAEIERIENEALRLSEMIGELLDLSRNQYQNQANYQNLNCRQIWSEVLNNAQFEAEQLNKQFTIPHLPPKKQLSGDANALCSALENVIRNAFRYCKQTVTIDFTQQAQLLKITVDDDGPGVPEQELEQIFKPFYRTDEGRDRASGGAGLGLAIVFNVIHQHNGQIHAEKSPAGGLRVVIQLPLLN